MTYQRSSIGVPWFRVQEIVGVLKQALHAWLLLTTTMDRSESANHCSRLNTYDPARRKTLLNDVQSASIVLVMKDRNNNGGISDVKVRVARRKPGMPIA